MPKFHYSVLVVFFLWTCTLMGQRLSDSAQISVLTCGKGDQLYSLFGHTALRISDPELRIDQVYNYGTFDFGTPNFALKFVKGDLQYFVSTSSFEQFLTNYHYEERSVLEQILNLSPDQKQQIFSKLNASLNSSDRFYTYKFIDKNCTTKVTDILNDVLGKNTVKKVGNTEVSYRDIIYPEFKNHFFEQWGTSLFFGTKVDQRAREIFLPIELWSAINETTSGNQPILKENKSWLQFDQPEPKFSWWNNVFVYVGFLVLLVFIRNKTLNIFYFGFMGLLGLFFCICGWYSLHPELQWNYNALLVNPLLLGVAIAMFRDSKKSIFYLGFISLLCLLLYLGCLIGKIHFLIVLPMIVTHAILLMRLAIQAKKSLGK